jgi:hypothetical protein
LNRQDKGEIFMPTEVQNAFETGKVSWWHDIWLNKRHYQIYFFGIATVLLLLAFAANFASISLVYNKGVSARYAATSLFTPSVGTSLSGTPIQVMSYRVNSAKNQMFILAQYADMKDVSLNIKNYELFITNANKKMKREDRPEENLRGQYYMFGSTGFVGIYIYTDTKFSEDYKWITVRDWNPVTTNRSPYVKYTGDDAKYDQYHIFVNPNATGVQTIDFLENHSLDQPIDTTDIYMQLIAESQELEIKNNIPVKFSELAEIYSHIGEYYNRLSNTYGLNMPAFPSTIEGDKPVTVEDKDAAGNVIGSHKAYSFASTVRGGIALDWANLSLRTGYYQSFYESNVLTLKEFIAGKQAELTDKTMTDASVITAPNQWTFSATGDVLDTRDPEMAPIVAEITTYNGYLTAYLAAKTEIQTKLYISLLQLEYTTNTYMSSAQILTDSTSENGTFLPALDVW